MVKSSIVKKLSVNSDYDPFGMITVGRNWVSGSENYRFDFYGKNKYLLKK